MKCDEMCDVTEYDGQSMPGCDKNKCVAELSSVSAEMDFNHCNSKVPYENDDQCLEIETHSDRNDDCIVSDTQCKDNVNYKTSSIQYEVNVSVDPMCNIITNKDTHVSSRARLVR